ncbi:hypothetical protein U8335_28315 [Roseiconus lacunae]|uniref:hypothetical protein n=1 Tax=Roseiconus lacunae TaxID=2605694 RepID=UPI0030851B38|nr:hypothetical protein U8335_28315 [Stieleria sp. HD01]
MNALLNLVVLVSSFFFAVPVWSQCVGEWSQQTAWGNLQAKGSTVTMKVNELPNAGYVSLPRLNNRLESVTAKGIADELRFIPEIDHWRVFVPKNATLPLSIEVKLLEKIRRCDAPFVVKPSENGKVTLPAHHAETQGEKLRFEPQPHKNTIGYWTVASDTATWQFEINDAREFSVVVHQGCGKGQGGSEVEFVVTSLSDHSKQTLPMVVKDTGHFQNFVPREIGSLKLDKGKYRLEVGCKKLANKAVCDIRKIEVR